MGLLTIKSSRHPLHYVWFSQFWSHFRRTMHCLPQRLKSTLFEIFSNRGCLKGTRSVEKISNNVDFSLWGNCATTWEYFLTFSSETKIMKITHSDKVCSLRLTTKSQNTNKSENVVGLSTFNIVQAYFSFI